MELRMQLLPTLLAAFVAILHLASPSAGFTRSDPVLVRAVIDGDTIDVSMVGRVRLLGIDAPEIGRGFDADAPFARQAKDRVVSLVLHRWVRLEQDGALLDVYNRHLAYVLTEDGVFVNVAIVRDGLARVSARQPLARLDELKRAEAEAQAFRRGIWGGAPPIPLAGYTARPGVRAPTVSPAPKKPKTRSQARKPRKNT